MSTHLWQYRWRSLLLSDEPKQIRDQSDHQDGSVDKVFEVATDVLVCLQFF